MVLALKAGLTYKYNKRRRDDPSFFPKHRGDDPAQSERIIVMAWVYLLLAGLFEIGWVVGMKYSQGFTKPLPTIATVIAMGISLWLLTLAVKTLPLGTSYAVWTGIGAIGAMIAGIILFGESASFMRIGSAALIVAGIIGLKLAT